MRVSDIGNNQIMVIDRSDKFITYEITPLSARIIEKRGDRWTPPRLKMAWNKAKEFFNAKFKT